MTTNSIATINKEPQRITVVKFGGSFATDEETGELLPEYFEDFLRTFATALIERCTKIGLVIGGGPKVRKDQRAAGNISSGKKDRMAKRIMLKNAEELRQIAGDYKFKVAPKVPKNPVQAIVSAHDVDHNTVSASWLKEHQSSDASAAFLFQQFIDALSVTHKKAELEPLFVNLSNVLNIFDKDPNVHPDAKPISFASLKGLVRREILSKDKKDFESGMNVPIDPVAVHKLLNLEKQGFEPTVYYTDGQRGNFDSIREILLGIPYNSATPRRGTRLRHTAGDKIEYYQEPVKAAN